MARAKHTDRADARRRYRQALAAEGVSTEGMTDDELDAGAEARAEARAEAAPRQARTAGQRRAAAEPPPRPGVMGSFRAAYHPAHIREDIAALPILLRSRAFLISAALVLGGLAAVAIAPSSAISSLAFQALVVPPAMAPVFIAGFFAKRASYIIGFLVALIDVAAYGIFLFAVAPTITTTDPLTTAKQQEFLLSALSVGPLSGIFFAAAAAWYRRFLALNNAGAAQRRRARTQSTSRTRANKPARG